MPIINGNCTPPLCFRIRWDTTKAALLYKKNNKVAPPPAIPAFITAAMNGGVPGVTSFADFLKTLVPVDIDCDSDCQCKPAANWPWQVVPDHLLYDDKKGWQVYVTGVKVQLQIAPCFAKPAPAGAKKLGAGKKAPGKKEKTVKGKKK